MRVGAGEISAAPSRLLLRRVADHGLPLPEYATGGAAGLDLRSAAPHVLAPGQRTLVGTGFAIALPPFCEGQIRPRSGLAARHGVTVLNAPGTVDADYRGEVKVLLINLGDDPVEISAGDRIAQLVVAPVSRLELVEVEELPETARDTGGFGSTGR